MATLSGPVPNCKIKTSFHPHLCQRRWVIVTLPWPACFNTNHRKFQCTNQMLFLVSTERRHDPFALGIRDQGQCFKCVIPCFSPLNVAYLVANVGGQERKEGYDISYRIKGAQRGLYYRLGKHILKSQGVAIWTYANFVLLNC